MAFPVQGLAFVALILGNIALANGPWLVRVSDTGPIAAGFWRMMLALPVLLIFAAREKAPALVGQKRLIGLVMLGGIFFALDLASWHVGILQTKLANATLFGNCTSLILPLVAIAVTRTWPTRLQWIALAIALAGALLLMGSSYEASRDHLVGDLLCVLAGLFYVGYLLVMQSARRTLPTWWLLALSTAACAPVVLLMAVAAGERIMPRNWLPLIGIALVSQIIGQGLLTYALPHFTPLVIGLALLTQPVVSAIIGWIGFGETLSAIDFAGAAIIAFALVLVRLPAGAPQAKPLEDEA
ncbi:DMT family transporter [Sphingobium sp. CR28]|uniref:DMT family transporter n=1 Tax=Sphingobium sp. CR28 TaxID=3400272 RepID=UPI003FF14D54